MATQWVTVGVCGIDGYMLMQKCLFQGKEFIYITEVHPRCELFGVWLCKESLGAKYITFIFFLVLFFSKVGQWPVLMMILKTGLLVVEGGLWVGITEKFLNLCFEVRCLIPCIALAQVGRQEHWVSDALWRGAGSSLSKDIQQKLDCLC